MAYQVPWCSRHAPPPKEKGFATLFFLAIITMGGLYGLVSQLNTASNIWARNAQQNPGLAQAKEALLGYISTVQFDSSCPSGDCVRPGELPCPDTTAHTPASSSYGAERASCASISLGRLPFKTLGLPEIASNDGERFWYAVSKPYRKGVNRTSTQLNSGTAGTISIVNTNGQVIAADVVAVVIAPGNALQRLASTSLQSRDDAGYTVASNYLDKTASVDNAAFSDDLPTLVAGPVTDGTISTQLIVNDRLIYITRAEVMAAAERRVLAEVRQCMMSYAADVSKGAYPWPSPFALSSTDYDAQFQASLSGRIPKSQTLPAQSLTDATNQANAAVNALATATNDAARVTAIVALATALHPLQEVVNFVQALTNALKSSADTVYSAANTALSSIKSYLTSSTASKRDQALADSNSALLLIAPSLAPSPLPSPNYFDYILNQNKDSYFQASLAWQLIVKGVDVYPYQIAQLTTGSTSNALDRQIDKLQLDLNDFNAKLASFKTVAQGSASSITSATELRDSAQMLKIDMAGSLSLDCVLTTQSTSGVCASLATLSNITAKNPSVAGSPGLVTSDANITSAQTVLTNAITQSIASTLAAQRSAAAASVTTSLPDNTAYRANKYLLGQTLANFNALIAIADQTASLGNNAVTFLKAASTQSRALVDTMVAVRPNLSAASFIPYLDAVLAGIQALAAANTEADQGSRAQALLLALTQVDGILGKINTKSTSITTALTTLRSTNTAAISSVQTMLDTYGNLGTSTTAKSSALTAAINAARNAQVAQINLLLAIEATNSSWATLMALSSNDGWVSWKRTANMTKARSDFKATPNNTATGPALRDATQAVVTLASVIQTYANYLATLSNTAQASIASAVQLANSSVAAPSSSAINTALSAAQAALGQPRNLDNALSQGQNASGTLPVIWPDTCQWLNHDQDSWWNHNGWRDLIFYQRTASLLSKTLSISDGPQKYSLILIAAGKELDSQVSNSGNCRRGKDQVACAYLEKGNADSSRDDTAASPITTFISETRSGLFNDQLSHDD